MRRVAARQIAADGEWIKVCEEEQDKDDHYYYQKQQEQPGWLAYQ